MDVLIILLFISLVLVAGAVLFFIKSVTAGDFEHGERLSLLPLEVEESVSEDSPSTTPRSPAVPEEPKKTNPDRREGDASEYANL